MSVILFGIAPSLVVSFDSSLTPHFFYQTITILPERLKGKFFGRSQHKCLIKKHLKEERKSPLKLNATHQIPNNLKNECHLCCVNMASKHLSASGLDGLMCNEGQSIQSKMFTGCGHRVDCWMMCKVIVHLLHHRIFPCSCFTHRVNQKNQKTEFIWERIWLARIRST